MKKRRLNPCCSGQWSRTKESPFFDEGDGGLNPCCSGQWSRTQQVIAVYDSIHVLILVVVDNGLVLLLLVLLERMRM